MISLVVARARNSVIGRDGELPWRLPSDLKRFKQITMGKPIIMGRKTWDSLPKKPLPGRRNIVLTRKAVIEGAEIAASREAALALVKNEPEICVIGGAEIYKLFLPMADRIYLTEVDASPAGDAYFEFDMDEWRETARELHPRGEKDSANFVLRTLERGAPLAKPGGQG